MNWNIVSNGGMTIAALAIADVPRHAAVTKFALAHAKLGIPLAVRKYGPANNGACTATSTSLTHRWLVVDSAFPANSTRPTMTI